jgi:drug/metabolite transporter (DMT)-like permease
MGGFFQNVFQVFFLIGLLLLYVISIIILKPFRIHRKRPVTTIFLKVTYLLFLFFFLVFTYLLLFGAKQYSDEAIPYDTLFNVHFLFFLSSTIVPNLGIMIRRRIKKKRVEYNLVVSIVNLIYLLYLIYAISSGKWALL